MVGTEDGPLGDSQVFSVKHYSSAGDLTVSYGYMVAPGHQLRAVTENDP